MVNTDKTICRMIASMLAGYGVKDVVISPGSRNTPLVMAICRNPVLRTRQIVDERTAAFIALGMASGCNRPVALVCTSGSAVLNFAPAVAEAYYRKTPLIVISADRPRAWIDQDDSQTIRQHGVLGGITQASCAVDDVTEDVGFQNRVLNDVLATALHGRRGPVHINVHLSAPLSDVTESGDNNDFSRVIEYIEAPQVISTAQSRRFAEYLHGRKILVVGGFMPPDARLNKALGELAALPQVAVVVEALANVHAAGAYNSPSALLSGLTPMERSDLAPDVVLSFGGALVNTQLKEFLRGAAGSETWCIGRNETTVDCFRTLSRRVEIEPAGFFPRLAGAMAFLNRKNGSTCGYSEKWRKAAASAMASSADFMSATPWSDLAVVSHILQRIPHNANLQLGNGMSVRNALLHDLGAFHRVDSNRGVSGIDGCVGTAVGAASMYNGLTYAIVGDMSATYDMGALAYAAMAPGLRLIVVNNGGGGIFHFVGTTRNLPEKDMMVNSPAPPLRQLAEAYGLRYLSAGDFGSLAAAMNSMAHRSPTPAVLEVFTDGESSAGIMRSYLSRNNLTNE